MTPTYFLILHSDAAASASSMSLWTLWSNHDIVGSEPHLYRYWSGRSRKIWLKFYGEDGFLEIHIQKSIDLSGMWFEWNFDFLEILIEKSIDLSEMWLKFCEKDGFLQILNQKPMDLSVFSKINENFRKKNAFLQILIQKPIDLSKKSGNFRKIAKFFFRTRWQTAEICHLCHPCHLIILVRVSRGWQGWQRWQNYKKI